MHNLYLGKYLANTRHYLTYPFTIDLHIGLVKTHFYHIWVQMKVLRENHELKVFHDLLAEVRVLSLRLDIPYSHRWF